MLVALEAGSFLRGLLLLLLCPLIRLLMPRGAAVRAMAAVSFCGLRAGRFRAGRDVLSKWLMEDVAAEAFEAVRAAGIRAVCVTALPRVMVDGFLREYLGVEAVVAREMKVVWGFYTGLMEELPEGGGEMVMKAVVAAPAPAAEEESDKAVVGFSGSMEFLNHPLARCCKEIFIVSSDEKSRWRALARDKYPKPIVFHDGRLAFRPTATDTAAMFAWLPLGVALGAARLAVALTVPYRYSTPILVATADGHVVAA
ncbi:unnamed protein product [Miscanthus lutarioriparius]|uniref:Glycerol-3-phosphate acyltransferase RAM2/GPAT1-8 HAD-like domain-containing protein n=1 Tax=Miscanthus lutarioriparius TaxID=422564 RepID=A0A811Q3Q3_9POAL|nr:unnamed protein product [Miscanthus lutarioriparius]